MKTRTLFLGLAWSAVMTALAGCRGIVGIHELEVADGGGASPNDDSGAESDGGTPTKDGAADSSTNRCWGQGLIQCQACCRGDNREGFGNLTRPTGAKPCYCGPSACDTACTASTCRSPQQGGPTPDGITPLCEACMEGQILGSQDCKATREACNDASCKAYLACEQGCK